MSHISGQVSSGCLTLLVSAKVWEVLFQFDEFLAEETRLKGCSRCGGKSLHYSNYDRADWGLPMALRGLHPRLSLSCDDCGKRARPPSVRYAGRRFYVASVHVVFSLLLPGSIDRVWKRAGLGISPGASTRRRWNRWWRNVFPRTARWRDIRRKFSHFAGETPLVRMFKQVCGSDWGPASAPGIPELLMLFRPFG